MLGCKPIDSPIEVNHHIYEGVGDSIAREMYQRLVGMIYLLHTLPDIAYVIRVVSQFMHDPCASHLEAFYRILRYLKYAPGRGKLFFKHGHLRLEAFTDADWTVSKDDRRSTSGYCTFLGRNLVTWRSKKQIVVARSSGEAKYKAMAQGVCELHWLKLLLKDLGVIHERSMRLYCDNKATISSAHNSVQHDRTKHIEIDKQFIKEKLDQKIICNTFVSS
ncbi:hypothetical protein CFOL_v3_11164 [Cephalotus follicularis]|uniref:RVT_2 domain-containing protein n=1 Tax=Cephalotus follicularis TaxID=3775 RepID=A0A1Q3BID2_CEPFO|nr:hypothetical protein CFOL_v3_11164 [Cephalotus follicularis]